MTTPENTTPTARDELLAAVRRAVTERDKTREAAERALVTLDGAMAAAREAGVTYSALAEATGLPITTIQSAVERSQGVVRAPSVDKRGYEWPPTNRQVVSLADLSSALSKPRQTVVRWLEAGRYGAEGVDWGRAPGGRGAITVAHPDALKEVHPA